jgi:hypothetical protein
MVGTCPIKVWSSRHQGPGLLVGLRHMSACHTARSEPNPRMDLERGMPWSVHLEATNTWAEHNLHYHFIPALAEYQPKMYSTLLFSPATQTYCTEGEGGLEFFDEEF